MTVELHEGQIAVLLSLDEARSLRKFASMAVPKERTVEALDKWHEVANVTQTLVFRMAALDEETAT